jgi:hypothetical protein
VEHRVAAAPSNSGPGSVPDLSGTWINRANGGICRIIQQGPGGQALFINEHGSQAWGTIQGDQVWIPGWQDASGRFGLVGRIRGNRINWPGGNFWYR